MKNDILKLISIGLMCLVGYFLITFLYDQIVEKKNVAVAIFAGAALVIISILILK